MSARHLRRFDLYPNRDVDLPYQPRSPRMPSDWDEIVHCRHDVLWTDCSLCSSLRKR